jgi:hypothetical protein
MKKIFCILLVVFTTILSKAQSTFLRTYAMHNAEYVNDKWDFDEGTPSSVLIELGDRKVVVYTPTIHTYHLTQVDEEGDGITSWNAVDENGQTCVFYFGITEDKNLYVMFEYGVHALLFFADAEK